MSALAAWLAWTLLWQNPAALFEKAPPAVDEALRARITKFFEAHVTGRLRAADEVVAEDSKEAFFSANKPRCYSFEIVNIDYAENFTRAKAVVTCEMEHPAPGLAGVKVKAPRTSLWKLEGGQWWYYIDPNAGYQTPFGVMRPGPGQGTLPPGIAPGVRPQASVDPQVTLSWVRPSKFELRFSSAKAGSDEVTLANKGPAAATLIMAYSEMPGLEITLDRKEIPPGDAARLTARWAPGKLPPPPTIPISIVVQPTGQLVMIRVEFARPGP